MVFQGVRAKRVMQALLLVLLMVFASPMVVGSANAEEARKFRIGYLEGGEYWIFTEAMKAIKASLERMGWADKVEFPSDAHLSPGWDKPDEVVESAKKLMARDDLDLIIGAGTAAAGALLKVNNGHTPILAMAVSDAVKSKLVINQDDSGVENFTVRIEPDRFKRMFRIFHDVVGFKKLGLMYHDSEDGRKYSNVEDARDVAKEKGFELVEYNKLSSAETNEECYQGLTSLMDQGVDAFFVPSLICFDWTKSDVKKLLDLMMEHQLPSFAREGTKFVKAGALMGFSTIDFRGRGEFLADKVVKILQGTKARDLRMVDDAMPKISLNLYVAEKIGFDPPFDILAASDETFQEITLPEERLVK